MKSEHETTVPAKQQAPASQVVVRGRIRDADGDAAPEVEVRLVARRLRGEETVGATHTDRCGAYELSAPAAALEGAALIVRAHRGEEKCESEPLFKVAAELTVDLMLGAGRWAGPTEYESVAAALAPELGGAPVGELTKDEVRFLAGRTGLPADRLQLYVWAQRRGHEAEVAPEALYALARRGLPTAMAPLATQPSPAIRAALTRAVAERLVPARAVRGAERTEARLRAVGAEHLARPGLPLRISLDAARLPAAAERRWLELQVSHGGAPAALRAAATADPILAPHLGRIELGVQIGALARGHAPLAAAIAELGATHLRDLARIPLAEWSGLLGRAGVPAETEGATPEAKRARFLEVIRRTFEVLCPTPTLAARLAQDQVIATADVRRFFERFPDFELRDTHVDQFILAHPEALEHSEDAPAMVRRLKLLQRLLRLSPRYEDISVLFQGGIDSAQRLVALGRATFLARHGQAIGAARAADVFERARQIAAAAALLHAQEIAAVSPATFPATRRPMPEET